MDFLAYKSVPFAFLLYTHTKRKLKMKWHPMNSIKNVSLL